MVSPITGLFSVVASLHGFFDRKVSIQCSVEIINSYSNSKSILLVTI